MYRLLRLALLLGIATASAGVYAQTGSQLQGSGRAPQLSYADIIGRWCGDSSEYYFDRDKLTVKLFSGGQNVLWVQRVETSDTWINVLWRPPYVNTVFQFSPDRRTIVQPPTIDGKGPRRVFHRC